ncbi:MAG TPA: helix-turn-helix domain-containing protein [Trueperaceae bacterium]|nr:helix-turn-helix domain-containing protein [Trueperaceae bacterium]
MAAHRQVIIEPEGIDLKQAKALRAALAYAVASDASSVHELRLVIGQQEIKEAVPAGVVKGMLAVLENICAGNQVSIMAAEEELTPKEAAAFLNVSRQYVSELIQRGELPAHKVGSHNRLYRQDVHSYRVRRDAKREYDLDALIALDAEHGLYDRTLGQRIQGQRR